MKIPQDFLTVHDTEKRSTLSNEEKEDLVVNAIASLYLPSKNKNIYLKRTKKNGLSACSRNETLSVLSWLENGKHLIKVDPSNYPYKIIHPRFPMEGDSYKDPVKIDPKTPLTLEVLPIFDHWHKHYKAKKDRALSDLEPDQIDAIRKLFNDIVKKYNMKPSGKIVLIEDQPAIDTIRHDALEYLKDEGVLYFSQDELSANSKKIEVYLDIKKLDLFREKNQELLSPSTKRGDLPPISLPPNTKWEDITIEFVDGHNINIKCKGKTIRRDYKEMGFENFKNRKPNKQWEFLQKLAENGGELSWNKASSGKASGMRKTEQDFGYEHNEDNSATSHNKGFSIIKAPDKTKKTKQMLSRALKAAFQIDSDPFFPYQETKSYKIRINLVS